MWFKHRAWIPVAWLLSAVNLGAVWFAAQPAEPWHATLHAALAVLLGLGAQRLSARRSSLRAQAAISDDQEERLEQAIDAIAVELERVGEGQRFVAKMLAERGLALDRSAASRPAEPVPVSRVPSPGE